MMKKLVLSTVFILIIIIMVYNQVFKPINADMDDYIRGHKVTNDY